ncbi:hypothetical protein HED49_05435 [Ochrobactrum daejeonense]|nr:hypothetical protein [Brucella daejeonensis]
MTEKQIIVASTHPFMADMRLGTAYLADALCKRGWHVVYIEQPTSPCISSIRSPGCEPGRKPLEPCAVFRAKCRRLNSDRDD